MKKVFLIVFVAASESNRSQKANTGAYAVWSGTSLNRANLSRRIEFTFSYVKVIADLN